MPNYLDYGGGTSLEELMMRLNTGAPQVGAINPELMNAPISPIAPTPEPAFAERLMKGMQAISPLLMKLGTTAMSPIAPNETLGSKIGGVLTSAAESQKLNEALRKMIADQLAGGRGGGFNEGQPVGLTGADVAGLTPEQISGLYGTGLNLRAAELKRPMDNLKVISEAYLHVMSGEAKPAEMQQHLATAQKALAELEAMPVTTALDWATKLQAINKSKAEVGEIQAKITTEQARPEHVKAETAKVNKQVEEITAKLDPNQVRALEFAKTSGGAVKVSDAGDALIIINPATGKEVLRFAVGARPETATKKATEELPLKKFAMQRVAPLVVTRLEAEMAAMPGGKQKVDLQNLISSLRGYTGEIDPGVLLAKSSPALQDKFNKLMDIYIKTPGLSETEFGAIVQGMIGPGTATPISSAPGKPSVAEKNKPTAAAPTPITAEQITKQLAGKPAGVYESANYVVRWDGNAVLSREPKGGPSITAPYNFGTFSSGAESVLGKVGLFPKRKKTGNYANE